MLPGNHLVGGAFPSVSLCGLSASVVDLLQHELTTETQRFTETQRLKELDLTYLKKPA